MMLKAIDSLIPINTSIKDFFIYWLTFLRPFHNLAKREIEVAANILYYRYELSKKIIDEAMLNLVLLNDDSKKHIMQECSMKSLLLQVILCNLKKSGFLQEGKINPRFIPHITESKGNFLLLFVFNFNED